MVGKACHVVPLLLEHARDLGTRLVRKANKAIIGAISSGKTRLFTETMRVISRASELGMTDSQKLLAINYFTTTNYLLNYC